MNETTRNTTYHIYGNIGQQIDHVDTIHVRFDKDMCMQISDAPGATQPTPSEAAGEGEESALPPVLNTPAARALLLKMQEGGLLDSQWRPLCSLTKAALIAAAISDRLTILPRWTAFEKLWGIKQLRVYYDKAMNQTDTIDFQEHINHILA